MGLFNRERIAGKTLEQLAGMRVAGLLVGQTLALLADTVRPGMTTLELDTLAETHIRDHGGWLGGCEGRFAVWVAVDHVRSFGKERVQTGEFLRIGDFDRVLWRVMRAIEIADRDAEIIIFRFVLRTVQGGANRVIVHAATLCVEADHRSFEKAEIVVGFP